MRWESIVNTFKPSGVVMKTFSQISLKIVILRHNLEGVLLDFQFVHKGLVESREIMNAVGR